MIIANKRQKTSVFIFFSWCPKTSDIIEVDGILVAMVKHYKVDQKQF